MATRTGKKKYTVVWRMEVDADGFEDAAEHALKIQRDKQSIATYFEVERSSKKGKLIAVDLFENRIFQLERPEKSVTVEVRGGCAEVTFYSKGVKANIIDHDNKGG